MVRRSIFILLLVLLSFFCFAIPASAEEKIDCASEYNDMLDALPNNITELLPDKLFSDNASDISEGASELLDFWYIARVFLEYLGLELRSVLKLFTSLLGILILSALLNSAKTSFSSSGASNAFSVMLSGAMILVAFSSEYTVIASASEYFSRLCIFANSLLPLTAALYAMGGNVASAVVHHSSLMIFLDIVESFCSSSAMPIAGMCMSFATVNAIAPEVNVGSLTAFFKRMYTQTLTFLMTVFMTVMGAQSLLAGKTDTITGKAVKLAVGNLIPTVGTLLSGSLGTVATSVEYIRTSVGVIGIAIIIIMLAPTLITLILTRLAFDLLSSAADILGCDNERKIISELSSINGFLLALAAICSICMIFIMTLFVKCSSATGGV